MIARACARQLSRLGVEEMMRTRRMAGAWLCAAAVVALSSGTARGAGVRIIDAVKSGSTQAVSALLKQKTDVNAAEADGTTALHHAAQHAAIHAARSSAGPSQRPRRVLAMR